MYQELLSQHLLLTLFEVKVAVFAALFAVYFTSFFEPVQHARFTATAWILGSTPSWIHWVFKPLYCPKCAAFWSAAAYMTFSFGITLAAFRAAAIAGVLGYLLDQRLNAD